ncbi:hypothetical protein M0805_002042 [Coniferiporia weirii]|nr:hypothetical protein M0805_002042 [Coniferiporia weirii]
MSSASIKLYTAATPNGWAPSILLEELKAVYSGPEYEVVLMSIRDADIGKVHNQVKSDWFLKINPNGRIPAISDGGVDVFETSAILLYFAHAYDKRHVFWHDVASDPAGYFQELSWIFYAHGGVGPMQGQSNHFRHYAPQDGSNEYGKKRYLAETERLYGVLESRLVGREYLVDTYGIADIKAFSWVHLHVHAGIEEETFATKFPNLSAWLERIRARPAVQAGLNTPPRK